MPNSNSSSKSPIHNNESTLTGYSVPSFSMSITLSSEQAARYIDRQWKFISGLLYSYDVILRARVNKFGDDFKFEVVDDEMTKAFDEFFAEVESELSRLQHLLDEQGYKTSDVGFSHNRDFTLEVATPLVGQLISLVQEVDKVEHALGAVWLKQIIESSEWSKASFSWQQRLFKFSRRLVNTINRAHKAANILEAKKGSESNSDASDKNTSKSKTEIPAAKTEPTAKSE